MTIKLWALNDQPAYKLYTKGAKFLSDTELIAILLQHGTAQNNAVDGIHRFQREVAWHGALAVRNGLHEASN